MTRRTQIICTLGPASSTQEIITQMASEGMDIARINFSHGTPEEQKRFIDLIREVNRTRRTKIKILQDLQGYRIRIGVLATPIDLKKGQLVRMACAPKASAVDLLPLDSDLDIQGLKPGMDIFIADGMIALKVLAQEEDFVRLEVVQGGVVSSKKGVNIPGLKLKADILTEKDRQDIETGVTQQVDYVAQSFVRNAQDIARVAALIKPRRPKCQVIAKIENADGVKNIVRIVEACDGIMVARGDLGVSLPIYEVPMIQKDIIHLCNRKRKMDITATQMLESMTEHFRPTRAEVSDVANAILDGSDCVMLSAETAAGKFPVESVQMMRQVIEYTERRLRAYSSKRKI